jgi:hypothetical protein
MDVAVQRSASPRWGFGGWRWRSRGSAVALQTTPGLAGATDLARQAEQTAHGYVQQREHTAHSAATGRESKNCGSWCKNIIFEPVTVCKR